MKKIGLTIQVLFLCIAIQAQDSTKISLVFIGDIMGHDGQINAAYDSLSNTYNFHETFDYIKDLISEADYAIANLEVTLAGKPYKGYPSFSSPDNLAVSIKDAGIDFLVTANNHTCDRGKKGILRTLDVLDKHQLPHTGSFRNQAEKDSLNPYVIDVKGMRIALLNYTYGTNGIPVPEPTKVNLIHRAEIKRDLQKADSLAVDLRIVFFHWGQEYQLHPDENQVALYEYAKAHGADLIIGSHPHVLQKMEWNAEASENDLVVYSLGNFVSNQRTSPRDGGAMAKIELQKTSEGLKISSASYYLTWVYKPMINGAYKFYILPASKYELFPDFFPRKFDYDKMMHFIKGSRELFGKENKHFRENVYSPENGLWKQN